MKYFVDHRRCFANNASDNANNATYASSILRHEFANIMINRNQTISWHRHFNGYKAFLNNNYDLLSSASQYSDEDKTYATTNVKV